MCYKKFQPSPWVQNCSHIQPDGLKCATKSMALSVKNLTYARSEVRGVCESDTLREVPIFAFTLQYTRVFFVAG